MACSGCGGRGANVVAGELAPGQRSAIPKDINGVYQLAGDEIGCTSYSGIYRSATVIVVGYNTPDERLFTKAGRSEAFRYAKEKGLEIVGIEARSLCEDKATELFSAYETR